MAKKVVIALSLVVCVVGIAWFLMQSEPEKATRPVSGSNGATETPAETAAQAVTTDDPGLVEVAAALPEFEVDLEEGTAGLRGTVRSPEGSVVAEAPVTLYRADLPEELASGDGLPMWNLFSWRRGEMTPIHERYSDTLDRVAQVTANESGEFQFTGLGAGSYLVAAKSDNGLMSPSRKVAYLTGDDQQADVYVEPAAELRGVVLNPDGSPVASAEVEVEGLLWRDMSGMRDMYLSSHTFFIYLLNPIRRDVKAGDEGEFTFLRLPALDYRITAGADPWADGEHVHTVVTREDVEIVLALGGVMTGRVVDQDGKPVADAEVSVREAMEGRWGRMMERGMPSRIETKTNSDGVFRVARLTTGRYDVSTEAEGFQNGALPGVSITAGETTDVKVEVERGGVIEGIVHNEQGEPIPGVEVRARLDRGGGRGRGGRGGRGRGNATEETDAKGYFRFDTLEKGDYRLEFRHDEWARQTVNAKTDEEPVDVALLEGLVVKGIVVTSEDAPLVGARVSVQSKRERGQGNFRGWGGGRGGGERRVTTDATGAFRIAGLDAGEYEFKVAARGYLTLEETIDAEEGDLGAVLLPEAVLLSGVVLDPDGDPLAGARVRGQEVQEREEDQGGRGRGRRGGRGFAGFGRGQGVRASDFTGEDGRFELQLPIATGDWDLTASFSRLRDASVEGVRVQGADIEGLTLQLSRGASIVGRVTGASGVPVANATVMLREGGGRGWGGMPSMSRSDADGYYVLSGLDAGEFEVRVQASGFANGTVPGVSITGEQQRTVDIALEAERVLRGLVISAEGMPVVAARVRVRSEAARRQFSRSDGNGAFEVGGLSPGVVSVQVDADGFNSWELEGVSPEAGELRVILEPAFTLSGVVLDAETREPIPRARITAREFTELEVEDRGREGRGRGRGRNRDRTDDEGIFDLEDIAAGEWTIEVAADGYIANSLEPVLVPGGAVEILLQAGGRIRGRLTDRKGDPVADARVRVYVAAVVQGEDEAAGNGGRGRGAGGRNRSVARGNSDETGWFEVTGIPDGIMRLTIEHNEFMPVTVEDIEVELGEPTPEIEQVMADGAKVTGRARLATGSTGVLVLQGGEPSVTRYHDLSDGFAYSFTGLAPGSYRLRYRSSFRGGDTLSEINFDVDGQGTNRVDLPAP